MFRVQGLGNMLLEQDLQPSNDPKFRSMQKTGLGPAWISGYSTTLITIEALVAYKDLEPLNPKPLHLNP